MTASFASASQRRAVAAAFLPSRWHYHYSLAKLATDPLYRGVTASLAGRRAPILDLGCGIGLLAHALRAAGVNAPYRGVDNDVAKVDIARAAAVRAGLPGISFETVDLGAGMPSHVGSCCLLDVLQFVPGDRLEAVLEAAAAAVAAGCGEAGGDAALIIRTGLDDGSWRARVTRSVDSLSRGLRWMNTGPKRYPTRALFDAVAARHGLEATCTPLFGRTPFNNHLVVLARG